MNQEVNFLNLFERGCGKHPHLLCFPRFYDVAVSFMHLDVKLCGTFHSLACRPSVTHSVPLQIVFELTSAYLRFPVEARRGSMLSEKSNTLCTRSSSRAMAKRPSCLSWSSSAFGAALENEVVYSGAFVPLLIRPPRPFETPILRGARPPTVHAEPRLTRRSSFVEIESRRKESAVGPGLV